MPIENTEEALAPIEKGIETNRTVMAGLAVRHALIPYRFIIEGFVIEDKYFNPNDFRVRGFKIEYKNEAGIYESVNNKIYEKVICDGKNNSICYYLGDAQIEMRSSSSSLIYQYEGALKYHYYNSGNGRSALSKDYLKSLKYNFYLFETTDTETPTCVTNEIYVLCKYWEEGKFKYMIFNLHEIKPDI
jgi:hypothetical protein